MDDVLNKFYREICSYSYEVDVDAPPYYENVVDMSNIKKVYEKFCGKQWYSEMIKPEVNKLVVVMDDMGNEFTDYFWDGKKWMFWEYGQGEKLDFESEIDIYIWKYQE